MSSLTPRLDRLEINRVINGAFDFWQRNTSFATPSNGLYTADRWQHNYNGTIGTFTISRQAFAVGTILGNFTPSYFLRWDQTVAGSGQTVKNLDHRIEGVSTFNNQTVTVSFWAKADSTRTVGVFFQQDFGSGGSPNVTTATQNINLTTGFQQFILTFIVPSIVGATIGTKDNLMLRFSLPLNVTFTVDLAMVMALENAITTDTFVRAGKTIAEELVLCQRYYEKSYDLDTPPGTITPINSWIHRLSRTAENVIVDLSVNKRGAPNTQVFYSPATGTANRVRDGSAASDRVVTATYGGGKYIGFELTGGVVDNQHTYHWVVDSEL
jgi:hypothetical protein